MNKQIVNPKTLVFYYLQLRKHIGLLGMSLPFVLSIGAWIFFRTEIQNSLSLYYHTSMKDIYVGTLCIIGFFLLSYEGYGPFDNLARYLGCFFAFGVAFIRTSPDPVNTDIIGQVHDVLAILFFMTLTYFCLFLFTKTPPYKHPSPIKIYRNRIYQICGHIMIMCIFLILLHYFLPPAIKSSLEIYKPAFWLESATVLAFSISWLTKGEEMLKNEM